MKFPSLGVIPLSLSLVACGSFNAPLSSDGSFDPLAAPGSGMRNNENSYGPAFTPGQFVTANIPNTAFFKNRPKGDEDADKLLAVGTNMKIVSYDGTYVKVELDNGEVGWVPGVMVASNTPEVVPIDGAYQVYPPLPGGGALEPLPVIDPGGLPPEGTIPAIIDPDAPAADKPITIDPVPDLAPAEPEAPVQPEAEKKTEE